MQHSFTAGHRMWDLYKHNPSLNAFNLTFLCGDSLWHIPLQDFAWQEIRDGGSSTDITQKWQDYFAKGAEKAADLKSTILSFGSFASSEHHDALHCNPLQHAPSMIRHYEALCDHKPQARVTLLGGAQRIASAHQPCTSYAVDDSGAFVAYVSQSSQGTQEIFIQNVHTGFSEQLTYLGDDRITVVGWHQECLMFASSYEHPFGALCLYAIKQPTKSSSERKIVRYIDEVSYISFEKNVLKGPSKLYAIQRHGYGALNWKDYQGGLAGQLWVANKATTPTDGHDHNAIDVLPHPMAFHRVLQQHRHNLLTPQAVSDREVYVLSDHQGQCRVYAYDVMSDEGTQHMRPVTPHHEGHVRWFSYAYDHVVYSVDGHIWALHIPTQKSFLCMIHTPLSQEDESNIKGGKHISDLSIDTLGNECAVVCRGQSFRGLVCRPTLWSKKPYELRVLQTVFTKPGSSFTLIDDGQSVYWLYEYTTSSKPTAEGAAAQPEQGRQPLDNQHSVKTHDHGEGSSSSSSSPLESDPSTTPNDADKAPKNAETKTNESKSYTIRWDVPQNARVIDVLVNPISHGLAFTTHQHQLIIMGVSDDYESIHHDIIDTTHTRGFLGLSWSPDGQWLAYSKAQGPINAQIMLWHKDKGVNAVTTSYFSHAQPCFDASADRLYFLSSRHFRAQMDGARTYYYLEDTLKPYVLLLHEGVCEPLKQSVYKAIERLQMLQPSAACSDQASPSFDTSSKTTFINQIAPENSSKEAHEKHASCPLSTADAKNNTSQDDEATPHTTKIDLNHIEDRIYTLSVDEPDEYVALSSMANKLGLWRKEGEGLHTYEILDFEAGKTEALIEKVRTWAYSADQRYIIYQHEDYTVWIVKNGEKCERKNEQRVRVEDLNILIHNRKEWQHMLQDAHRLQCDFFWKKDIPPTFLACQPKYEAIVERVATKRDVYGLIQEMQGELRTSHAYIKAATTTKATPRTAGYLGARFEWCNTHNGYRITHIDKGDVWNNESKHAIIDGAAPRQASAGPLNQLTPYYKLSVGDVLLAINGHDVTADRCVEKMLSTQYPASVMLKIYLHQTERTVYAFASLISTLSNVKYRDWVEKNRAYVKMFGDIGYIHIPDMGQEGYEEFMRSYIHEWPAKKGIIVDVRYNGGGFISPMILDALSRPMMGYDETRWHGRLAYPYEGPQGPLVALCNGYTGSDGDMFCYAFRKKNLGPLIGARTWGGVVGIAPQFSLIDGSLTTQPEYAVCFYDVGYSVENTGIAPDEEVDALMQLEDDPVNDQQLNKAISHLNQHT